MSAIMSEFNASVFISEQLNRMIINAAQDLAKRSVAECATRYNFDAEDAFKLLGLQNVRMERSKPLAPKKAPKEKAVKAAFPLPFNGLCAANCCSALRQNQGLYTQCTLAPKKGKVFCKACQLNADKNGGVPEYGTIAMRQAAGLYEYVDPKGRKPVSFTKVMKKYKIDQAAAVEEAAKFGIVIAEEHFVVPAETSKGRPKKEKVQAQREKGAKGRPKKAKKMLQIEGDEDDLFASLVADANAATTAEPEKKKRGKSDEEKEQERIAKENEKKEKEAKRAAEKAEKEAKEAAEKAAKAAKAAEEKAAREAKKKAEEDEKLAKKAAAELAKKEKEAKLAAEKAEKEAAKEAKKSAKPAAKPEPKEPEPKEPEVEEEPDVVKKIEFEGKKYLKSKKTGIVYDYTEYVKNGEQVIVGKWNDAKNKIDFANDKEEEEEEYAM